MEGVTLAFCDIVMVWPIGSKAVTYVPAGMAPAVSMRLEPELLLLAEVPATISAGIVATALITFEPPVTVPMIFGSPKLKLVGLPIR